MWIWITCLVVLIICFIVAWRMLVNSYDPNNEDKRFRLFNSFSPSDISYYTETMKSMRTKLKSLEDKSEYYESQIERLNKKLKVFEKGAPPAFMQSPGMSRIKDEEEEDWKELYYEENAKKEKIENELESSHKEIEFLEEELIKLKSQVEKAAQKENAHNNHEEEITSLRSIIAELQKEKDSAAQLQKLFADQKKQLEEATRSLQILKSENETLQSGLASMTSRQSETEMSVKKIGELENQLKTLAEEKESLEKKLSELILENQHLQERLHHETELKDHFEETANSLATVKNENEGLHRQIAEMATRQSQIEGKILYLTELENKVTKYEEDKLKMIADLEMILSQTRYTHS